uniref:Melanoma associated antigen (Mutated) 1 n=2 Tax=Nothobranchius korthausae TaxID=1143690 RepID=A0A1A8H9V8_9TELE
MKGGRCKTRNIKPKKRQRKNVVTDTISSPRAKKSRSDDQASLSLSTCISTTPKRSKRLRGQQRDVILTSTPVRSSSSVISHPSPQINEVQPRCLKVSSKAKTSEGGSQSISRSQNGRKRRCSKSRKVEQKSAVCQPTGVDGSTAKQPRGRLRKTESGSLKGNTLSKPCKLPRPRFELQMPDTSDHDESLLSSDLSIELSHYEEQLPSLSFQEDETSDDQEEELPSFLMPKDTRPSAITDRAFAWCKFRNYPFWPAWVKSVNRKQKKASIIFVDGTLADNHRKKGFTVALKSLKPFDCEESEELTHKAKETYEAAVSWSLELIDDYIIRIACGSFSGSFIEYVNHAMSYPVRRKHPQAASERLTIASDSMTVESCDDLKEDSINENKEVRTSTKRLLPDRTLAAYNRANEKLVHFIVKQRMVEPRLLAVIHGQQQSRWLRSFLSAKRKRVVNIYLEDDQQLDQVYQYLNELCTTATSKSSCLLEMKPLDQVPFVLDVLLPEAIIYAIAGVDNVSVKKAEEKYLNGRCLSNREKEEFDLMIEHQMRRKEHQSSAADMLSDVIN